MLCTDMRMHAIENESFCRVLLKSLLRVVLVEVVLLFLSVVPLCRNNGKFDCSPYICTEA